MESVSGGSRFRATIWGENFRGLQKNLNCSKAGSSGAAIYSFVFAQNGQNLNITDNNGAVSTVRIKGLRSASSVSSTNCLSRDGNTFIATSSTEGTSAAGKYVSTFRGTVSPNIFTCRTMQST